MAKKNNLSMLLMMAVLLLLNLLMIRSLYDLGNTVEDISEDVCELNTSKKFWVTTTVGEGIPYTEGPFTDSITAVKFSKVQIKFNSEFFSDDTVTSELWVDKKDCGCEK